MATKISNLPPDARANLPKPGKVGKFGLGMNLLFAGVEAVDRVKEGEGVVSSIGKAGVNMVIGDAVMGLLGAAAIGIAIAGTVASVGGSMLIENGRQNTKQMAAAYGGGGKHNKVINSDAAATMRQRGMAMINQNGEATRSVLGSEARAYFRNSQSQY